MKNRIKSKKKHRIFIFLKFRKLFRFNKNELFKS